MKNIILKLILIATLAISTLQAREVTLEENITGLYVAYFNRAADYGGFNYWKNIGEMRAARGINFILTLNDISAGFAEQPIFTSIYDGTTNEEFVAAIYRNSLGREGDRDGIAYWTSVLDQGILRSKMVAGFTEATLRDEITQENFPGLSQEEIDSAVDSQNAIRNKVAVAIHYTNSLKEKTNVVDPLYPEEEASFKASLEVLSNVTSDDTTKAEAIEKINGLIESDNAIDSIVSGWNDIVVCIQVISYATNPDTGVCQVFPTPCDVPDGWNRCIPTTAQKITTNEKFLLVKNKAKELIRSGFTAGDGYEEVWIRDFNTFMELSCDVVDSRVIREKLLIFFKFQGIEGDIIDAYLPQNPLLNWNYHNIYSNLEPDLVAHKNTVETDQETSLVQGVYKYIKKTAEYDLLELEIDGMTVSQRMELALEFLMNQRFNYEYGLIWGATTADWGDVQPEDDWGIRLTDETHYAFDIYDNAMLVIAMKNFIELVPESASKWNPILEELEINIRKHLWDQINNKFYPHIYINSSPFAEEFNENEIFYHGGTAVAIEAGLLSSDEIKISLEKMIENVEQTKAGSIGLTLYPAYPEGSFKNPIMSAPYTYQNGGDWTWFGARMIQQLVIHGFVEDAYEQILPMTDRVIKNNGFFEWYSINNEPQGSSSYRASAGVLYKAIILLDLSVSETESIK